MADVKIHTENPEVAMLYVALELTKFSKIPSGTPDQQGEWVRKIFAENYAAIFAARAAPHTKKPG